MDVVASVAPVREPESEPRSDPAELRILRASCKRFLNGHGLRTADVWSEITDVLGEPDTDVYGAGGVVEELESESAVVLGKPKALFMASGTIAQQVAPRVHAVRTGHEVVLCHPTCHLINHEDQAAERLHRPHMGPVGSANRLLGLDDLSDVVPDTPVTNMAHLHLDGDQEAFATATRRLASTEGVWSWPASAHSERPRSCRVELTVGDATLGWSAREIRNIVKDLLNDADHTQER